MSTKIKKRKYSRNGCKECKRRKLKCDEEKPACWQCSRLGKQCHYLESVRFSDERTITVKNTGPGITTVQVLVNDIETKNKADQTNRESEIIQDASILAQDIIESINSEIDDFIIDLTLSEYEKKKNILDSFSIQEPHKTYLEIFYDKYSHWIFPLDAGLANDIMLFHAKSSPYLLAAILCLVTNDKSEKDKYIATCLRSLSNAFQSDQSTILNNIEPLILTILLLASEAGTLNWRVYLRGAKDLLMKHFKFRITPSLLLAKSWISTIEILATIQTKGTIKDDNEIDELFDTGLYSSSSHLAIKSGLLLENGYDLFLGYSSEAQVMYREWCKLCKNGVTNDKLLIQMSLIHSAKEFQVASSKVLIEKTDRAHPDYPDPTQRTILPITCYGLTKTGEVYSWFDLIHQTHVDALLLRVYTDFFRLSDSNPLVQELVKQILDICYFFEGEDIKHKDDARLLMVQSTLLACGMHTKDEESKRKVQSYFNCLVDMKVKSAPILLKQIQDHWLGHESEEVHDLIMFV